MNIRSIFFTASAIAVVALIGLTLNAEEPIAGRTIHLDAVQGNDDNEGTKEHPLRTIAEAARRVNEAEGDGAIDIVLAEGVYALGEPARFEPTKRSFTRTERLTIRAAVLPERADCTPQQASTTLRRQYLLGTNISLEAASAHPSTSSRSRIRHWHCLSQRRCCRRRWRSRWTSPSETTCT